MSSCTAAREADEVLLACSIRGGKTQACCHKLVAWAWQHPCQYLIGRARYRELEDSTKRVFLHGDGALRPAFAYAIP